MSTVGTSEESRALLQDRLAVFGKWMFLMVVAIGLTVAFIEFVFVDADSPWQPGAIYEIVFYVIPLGMWVGMRRGNWPTAVLRGVDAAVMAAYGGAFTVLLLQGVEMVDPHAGTVFAAGIIAIARAIVIPSAWRRTLWISALCVAPAAFAAGRLMTDVPDASEYQRQSAYITSFCWATFGVTVATVASRIIFGLRREARRAKRLGQYHLDEKIGEGGMGAAID